MRWHSGLFLVIALAMSCKIVVLPALGGDTISARWPFPIGMIRSITRVVSRSVVVSSRSRWLGQRRQLAEVGPLPGVFDGATVDAVQAHQRVELLPLVGLLAVAGHPNRTGHRVAAAQAVLAHHVHRHVDVVRTGEVTGGAHERVIVEDVKDAGDRLNDVVLAQFGVGAIAGSLTPAPAVAEPASPPALTALTVVVAAAPGLLATRALLVAALVAAGVLSALVGLGVLLAALAVVGLALAAA